MNEIDDTPRQPRGMRDQFSKADYDFLERVKAQYRCERGQRLDAGDLQIGGVYWVEHKRWMQAEPRLRRLTVVALPLGGDDLYQCVDVNGERVACSLESFVATANSM